VIEDEALLPLIKHRSSPGESFVRKLGLVAEAFSTIQIDLNPVRKSNSASGREITLCDHNCTTAVNGIATGGQYDCPAAISLNRGGGRGDLAPAESLTNGLHTAIAGIRQSQLEFLHCDLDPYLDAEGVPPRLRLDFRAALAEQRLIVNLFGGSPELHPGVLEIIEDLHAQGVHVHLTTTGRRIIRDPNFRADFLDRPPDLIGLGADDFDSAEDIDFLFQQDFDALTEKWRQVPWVHGQRKKAIEAVQLCKLAEVFPIPPILFNIVLHGGNLERAEEILDCLTKHVPSAVLNPYPAQTAFLGRPSELQTVHLRRLRRVAELAVQVHTDRLLGRTPRWNLAPRVGYWILVLSLLGEEVQDPAIANRVGGDGVWRCYTKRGAGRCVQIGAAGLGTQADVIAGGYLGCFWNNSTITDIRQVWSLDESEVADWILNGRQRKAERAVDPCRGCLFPRMSMDAVSLELGLQPSVVDRYRQLRFRYIGY
jgi:hypothetical protein